jgi:putative transposase
MRDTLYSGRVFRTLNVIDEANRGALGIDVAVSIPAARVSAFLAQMIDLHGRPSAIRCNNGPELTSQTFTDWCRNRTSSCASGSCGCPHCFRRQRSACQ